jgi:flagellar biosynthetic protein FliR
MLTFTYAQLNGWITAFLWPFARILALVATAPVIGHAAAPARVKIGLAAFIAIAVAPTLPPMPAVTPFSAAGVFVMVNQVLIGAALGVTMQVVFAGVEAMGGVAGMQMGLSFASFFTAHNDGTTQVLAQFVNLLALLVFLAIDGHLHMLAALVSTFELLPIGGVPLGANGWHALAEWGGMIFTSGLLLALPVIAALLIANLALGILNRAAPQIGVFQIGFPMMILVGFLMLQLMLPNFAPFVARLVDAGIDQMGRVAVGLKP